MKEYLITFLLFTLIQGIIITGLKSSFEKDMIFEKPAKWVSNFLGLWWSKPIVGCIRCMASFWGAVTYWPVILWAYDFGWWMFPVYVADVFMLVYINWFLYKKQ